MRRSSIVVLALGAAVLLQTTAVVSALNLNTFTRISTNIIDLRPKAQQLPVTQNADRAISAESEEVVRRGYLADISTRLGDASIRIYPKIARDIAKYCPAMNTALDVILKRDGHILGYNAQRKEPLNRKRFAATGAVGVIFQKLHVWCPMLNARYRYTIQVTGGIYDYTPELLHEIMEQ